MFGGFAGGPMSVNLIDGRAIRNDFYYLWLFGEVHVDKYHIKNDGSGIVYIIKSTGETMSLGDSGLLFRIKKGSEQIAILNYDENESDVRLESHGGMYRGIVLTGGEIGGLQLMKIYHDFIDELIQQISRYTVILKRGFQRW